MCLLSLHQLANADCNYPVSWSISITNNTKEENIEVSCPSSSTIPLAPGDSHPFYGQTGDYCADHNVDGVTCTYKDTASGETGSIKLAYNSCITVTHQVSTQATTPVPAGCEEQITQTGHGGHAVCDGVDGYSYYTYAADAAFSIVDKGPTFNFDWTGINLSSTQGQVLGDKLAKSLLETGNYSTAIASYDKANSKLTIKVEGNTDTSCS